MKPLVMITHIKKQYTDQDQPH